ncbi:diguanylate cyclase/phosphodiesterase (GGDEF & EAL domains) with PAS/PAC sensor(s) [Pacificimonas flava]|uniref:Diguanylate cyclase/phosphodiesterase (GGDEF & EAL domains) with PAS/PAC sensor(S) n=1 Tax=Pacificimonas flava TaxID=1234595 RepID=M2TL44_9SPHN|nr:diguanylate cyclase/phosphodiesterase (GGDEF & EAL domains) with PAS/PAC sensor(s) [Pacificimonas flava]
MGERQASGEILIVEIDPKSIDALKQWPWPRRLHAQALNALSERDPRLIAFDVDFSSRQSPEDDAALSRALQSTKATTVLAAFEQASAVEGRSIAALPLPALRSRAFIGNANVRPDPDGAVRTYPVAAEIAGQLRPSLATLTAEANVQRASEILIDYSIDPASIPRLSFIDLLRGDVAVSAIQGKRILIGATAIELGDRYHIPGRGLLPGVVVQALAAETMLLPAPPIPLPRTASALVALLIGIALAAMFGRQRHFLAAAFMTAAATILSTYWVDQTFGAVLNLAIPTLIWGGLFVSGLALEVRLLLKKRELLNPVTDLPNRRLLERELMKEEHRALALVRVQGYDRIASAFGVDAAQMLILSLARLISVRSQDAPVYQLSNNLLAVLLDPARTDPEIWFAGVEMNLRQGVSADDIRADIRVVAGFDLAGPEADPNSSPIDRALLALSQAEEGKRRLGLSGGQQDRDGEQWRVGLAATLRKAIEAGHLRLTFQPKMCIGTGEVTHVEALVRWLDPERGPIFPDQFIPLAEANGSISDLTRFVVAEAADMIARLRANGLTTGVAVNISTNDLADPAFVEFVAETLRRTGIPPDALTLEITETGLIEGRTEALVSARRLKALGLRLSIDDYGTGQSTMAYVEQFPADELKIDMSFVMRMTDDRANAILVKSAIDLGHALGLSVVAEGVETAGILTALREQRCDYAQGYHISRPLEADDLFTYLSASREGVLRSAA